MIKDEIIKNIKNRIKNLMWYEEVKAYINGYLGALLDCYEIDSDTYNKIKEELEDE